MKAGDAILKPIKAKVRAQRETSIAIEIEPAELRRTAERLEIGGIWHSPLIISGLMNGEKVELRFMRPLGKRDVGK